LKESVMRKAIVVLVGLLCLGLVSIGLSSTALAAKDAGKPDSIGDGKVLELKDKEFSITPPTGWEVFSTHPSLSLLMQVPYDKSLKYQRTIQVMARSGLRYMDDVTAREYEQFIVREFSKVSVSIEDYKLRNHVPIQMADGRQGLLFYTEFKLHNVNLMQAHILVSSPKRHYLITFTDVAEHFEKDDSSQFLAEAWDSMTSIKIEGAAPKRFNEMKVGGIAAGVLVVLSLLFWATRTWRAGRRFKELGDGKGLDDVDVTEPEKFIVNSRADKEPESGLPDEFEDEDGVSKHG